MTDNNWRQQGEHGQITVIVEDIQSTLYTGWQKTRMSSYKFNLFYPCMVSLSEYISGGQKVRLLESVTFVFLDIIILVCLNL